MLCALLSNWPIRIALYLINRNCLSSSSSAAAGLPPSTTFEFLFPWYCLLASQSEMWRRANQFVILLAKHNKAFNGLISGYDGPASDSSPASPHNWVSNPTRCCLLLTWLVAPYRNQRMAGRQADLKSRPSECTRAKFPIIHDSNFQNRCSWSFLSPLLVVASLLVRLI